MDESSQYLDNEDDYTAEEKREIVKTIQKIRKKKLEKQNDSDDETRGEVEEVMSPAVMWEKIMELEARGHRKSTGSSSSSSSTVLSVERKFEVLKCSNKEKGNPLPADQVHTFADILSSNSAKRGTGNC